MSHRRRGVGYFYFLSTMMLIAVIAVSALMAARIQLRSAGGTNDSAGARLYAQSAIELGLAMIQQDDAWRSSLGSGAWFTDLPIGDGTMSLESAIVSDADGYPNNDPVVFVGTGVHGQAKRRIEVTISTLSDKGGLVIAPESWRRVGN